MTEEQHEYVLTAVKACVHALGDAVAGDKPAPEAYARGLAYVMARLLGTPRLVRCVAGWALNYLPEAEPTAAAAGKGDG